ncbi:hypothetical protein FHS29_006013 [Saccharothrix tamanrassetensis]|uniref:Membrane-associated oxidoreductase n=1 Tax=Saccharothrix tamanrassetensis TaxID=1051531 RepID=A0A841CLM9_9PSEU|nr:hypothetical protein [Saccharothrix tamanrassetensis]MBB5959392.1 hypothetical protein [Saccharothrix tamanrassetensis]
MTQPMDDEPNEAEQRLADAIRGGDEVVEHSASGERIRGSFLGSHLLWDGQPHPRILKLYDAHLTGRLDLEAGAVAYPVHFRNCRFDEPPNLEQAAIPAVYFTDCALPGLDCGQVTVSSNVELTGGASTGTVDFRGARVGGQWRLTGIHLVNAGGVALSADGIVVGQDAACSDGFVADGAVRMIGARIGGQFDCENATFRNPGGIALELSGLVVKEKMFWRNGFRVEGEARLRGARVKGRIDCAKAEFRNPHEVALSAEGLRAGSDVLLGEGCSVKGEVDLTGCDIRGQLILTGGTFGNPGRTALDLARARVAQNVLCRSGFVAKGTVLLVGAEIRGNLWCEGGRFENSTDTALDAVGLTVHRDLVLGERPTRHGTGTGTGTDGFYAEGRVVLSGSTIGGNFSCAGGKFTNRPNALECVQVEVRQSADFERVLARGRIDLCGARIGGQLSFADAVIGDDDWALVLKGAVIGGPLRLKFADKPKGGVDLYQVRAAHLDDRETKWPDRMRLNGFVYGALAEGGPDVGKRIDWLKRNWEYTPQVYLQLASLYEAQGLHNYAKDVLVAGEDARRAARKGMTGRLSRVSDLALKYTVGYGYRPFLVLIWIAVLWLLGWGVFSFIGKEGFKPVRPDACLEFQPFVYTLDLLLPVVTLKQRDFWVPEGLALGVSTGLTIVGWVLAICLVTGLGKAFKREL